MLSQLRKIDYSSSSSRENIVGLDDIACESFSESLSKGGHMNWRFLKLSVMGFCLMFLIAIIGFSFDINTDEESTHSHYQERPSYHPYILIIEGQTHITRRIPDESIMEESIIDIIRDRKQPDWIFSYDRGKEPSSPMLVFYSDKKEEDRLRIVSNNTSNEYSINISIYVNNEEETSIYKDINIRYSNTIIESGFDSLGGSKYALQSIIESINEGNAHSEILCECKNKRIIMINNGVFMISEEESKSRFADFIGFLSALSHNRIVLGMYVIDEYEMLVLDRESCRVKQHIVIHEATPKMNPSEYGILVSPELEGKMDHIAYICM
jgi:hypothetical protein